MEREKLESMLIDYIDGNLGEKDRLLIESELEKNPDAKTLYYQLKEVMVKMGDASQLVPSESLKNSFEHFLSQEVAKKPEAKSVTMTPMFYRIAASIVLLMAVGASGYFIRGEMNKREVMALLENEFSASQRIQGVSVAYEMSKPDDEIVTVLVKTFNHDPNTNVRLAALDALSKFSSEEGVRKSLIESLSTETDPIIQIALIRLMVEMKERTVIQQLEKIAKDSRTIKAVKTEAYSGIFKLS
jgi:anti-sigma factor RsiW